MAVVLCTGHDKSLMETRRLLLEADGHKVIPATTELELQQACSQNTFDIAILGQSLPSAEKHKFFEFLQHHCPRTRVLELYTATRARTLSIADGWLQMPLDEPSELANCVAALTKKRADSAASRTHLKAGET